MAMLACKLLAPGQCEIAVPAGVYELTKQLVVELMEAELRKPTFGGQLVPFLASLLWSLAAASVALLACLAPPNGPGSRHALGSGIPEIKVAALIMGEVIMGGYYGRCW